MPMLSAMARTTVGPAPRNSPIAPSSFTILTCSMGMLLGLRIPRRLCAAH